MDNNENLFKLIKKMCDMKPSHLLIVGDFNIKEINWVDIISPANETHISTKFIECIRNCFLFQHVMEPTRYRSDNVPSILDLIFTNEENMVLNLSMLPGLGKRDHVILNFNFNCYTNVQSATFKKYNFFKGKYSAIEEDLGKEDWSESLRDLPLAESWDLLTDKITRLIEKNVPESKISPNAARRRPYVNQACLNTIRVKHRKWTKYRNSMSDRNYDIYKSARNKAKAELRKAKYEYERDLASKIKTDNKLFWSYVRSKTKTKSSLGELEMPSGDLTSDSQEKANILNKFFVSVFENEGNENLPDFQDRPFIEPLHLEIKERNLEKAIDKVKETKSKGPDNIHPMLIKKCKKSLLTPLRIIFTKSLEEEKIPDIWKVGHISAIHKSGSGSKAENYRPISLTSVPGKIMERLIRDRIVDHMTENNFFFPEQHGFISGKSCTTQLLEFLEDLTEALDSGKDVDVIYLDFQKAFDKVPHKRLLKKLWAYGIRGKIHSWIKEFLSNRIQTVLKDGNSSSKAKVTSGIPQGSVLGPILFLIFINDLPSVIQALKKLFADDAKVYQIVTCMADVTHLQSVVNNSIDWSILWKMFINFKKCKHMHLGNHDMNHTYTMKKDQEEIPIEKVVSEKDLGVIVDNTLTFTKHISSKIKTANRNLGIIFRTFTYLDKDIFMNLLKSLVRTHLEYASPVWSPVFKKIELL